MVKSEREGEFTMKVLAFIPNSLDGTSFYRGCGALNELHKLDERVQIQYVSGAFRFGDAKGFDIAFFQRSDTHDYIITMQALKALGIPIVVDYDDYLLGVPQGNKYHRIMSDNDIPYEQNVATALRIADRVIVSTQALKEAFSRYNRNITVIRNAFDDYTFTPCTGFNNESRKVLWRGGSTHQPDFNYYGDEIIKLITENKDFEFIFWTDATKRPENLAYYSICDQLHKLPNFKLMQAVSPIDYFQGLQKMKPALILSVNRENLFNLCKSDIAKLEGFYCGALCVHDDWPEWIWGKMKIGEKYLFDRANYLLSLIRNPIAKSTHEIYDAELNYVLENRLLSTANLQRLNVFRRVLK
jgi:glycosyltransferase involved in cell wall biosynthesis